MTNNLLNEITLDNCCGTYFLWHQAGPSRYMFVNPSHFYQFEKRSSDRQTTQNIIDFVGVDSYPAVYRLSFKEISSSVSPLKHTLLLNFTILLAQTFIRFDLLQAQLLLVSLDLDVHVVDPGMESLCCTFSSEAVHGVASGAEDHLCEQMPKPLPKW